MADVVFAEYPDADKLIAAIHRLRGDGFKHLNAYTPYPIPAVLDALEMKRSQLPVAIFGGGMLGAGGAFFLQWYLVAYLYPLNVGGRPPFMPLPFLIITFEMGVLFAAFTAFFGVLIRSRLFRLWDPVFELDGFEGASSDRHWLRVDKVADVQRVTELLDGTGALRMVNERGERV